MTEIRMHEEIDQNRRQFFSTAAITIAAAQLGLFAPASAQTSTSPTPSTPGKNISFAPLRQIDAGVLNIGYAEAGRADGPVVILLHGWPYDIYSFFAVAPLLESAGYRV